MLARIGVMRVAFLRVSRAGRGQVGPCLTDEAHRPLPERRPYVSRYADARTLRQRSLRQILQVESFYLLCSRPTQLLALIQSCAVLPTLSSRPSTPRAQLRLRSLQFTRMPVRQ